MHRHQLLSDLGLCPFLCQKTSTETQQRMKETGGWLNHQSEKNITPKGSRLDPVRC